MCHRGHRGHGEYNHQSLFFLPWGSTISKGNVSLPNGRLNPANFSVISVFSVAIYGATEDTESTPIKAYFFAMGFNYFEG